MLPLINGKRRIDREIAIEEARQIATPDTALVYFHRSDRPILDLLAAGHRQRGQRYRQHQIAYLHF